MIPANLKTKIYNLIYPANAIVIYTLKNLVQIIKLINKEYNLIEIRHYEYN